MIGNDQVNATRFYGRDDLGRDGRVNYFQGEPALLHRPLHEQCIAGIILQVMNAHRR